MSSANVARFKLNARVVCTKSFRMPNSNIESPKPQPKPLSNPTPPSKSINQSKPISQPVQPIPTVNPAKKRGRSSHVPHPSVTSVSLEESDLANQVAAQPINPLINQSMDNIILGSVQNVSQSTVTDPNFLDTSMFPYRGPIIGTLKQSKKKSNNQSINQPMDTSDDQPTVTPKFPVIIPSTASWFDYDSIHQIERSAFPEIFNQSVNQSSQSINQSVNHYKSIRNQLIDCYRLNPRIYLTITAARRFINHSIDQSTNQAINTSVNQIISLHTFLEKWGLINFCNDSGSEPLMGMTTRHKADLPVLVQPPVMKFNQPANEAFTQTTSQSINQSVGQSNAADVQPLLKHLYAFPDQSAKQPSSQSSPPSINQSIDHLNQLSNRQSPTQVHRTSLVGPVKAQDRLANDPFWSLNELPRTCSSCNQVINHSVDKSAKQSGEELFYQSPINQSIILCVDCFARGIFPDKYVAADFVRMTTLDCLPSLNPTINKPSIVVGLNQSVNPNQAATQSWSRADTLRLIDLLHDHGEDWETIGRLMDRSVDDCVMHFISLPIEDPFTEQYPRNKTSTNQSINQPTKPVLPFADVGNPVLAQIAFLASTVSPSIASMAAAAVRDSISHQHIQNYVTKSLSQSTNQSINQSADQSVDQPNHQVETLAGVGELVKMRDGGMVEVKLPFGQLYAPFKSINPLLSINQLKSITDTKIDNSQESIQTLSLTAINAAVVKADELSAEEERKLLRLIAELITSQLKKCDLKIRHLNALNEFVDGQTVNLEQQRLAIIAEQVKIQNQLNAISMSTNQSTSMQIG